MCSSHNDRRKWNFFCSVLKILLSPDIVVGIATMLLAVGSRFRIRMGAETSRTAVAPTQPLTEWTSSFFLGGKVVGDVNSTTHLHLVRSLRLGGAVPPICPGGGIFICLKFVYIYIYIYTIILWKSKYCT